MFVFVSTHVVPVIPVVRMIPHRSDGRKSYRINFCLVHEMTIFAKFLTKIVCVPRVTPVSFRQR